jgi:hypothetical protein
MEIESKLNGLVDTCAELEYISIKFKGLIGLENYILLILIMKISDNIFRIYFRRFANHDEFGKFDFDPLKNVLDDTKITSLECTRNDQGFLDFDFEIIREYVKNFEN